MEIVDCSDRYCVVGAGPSGLAAAKNFRQQGVLVECFEREDDVGGTWYYGRPSSSVYASTHLISSKRLTQFTDFPMPDDYPAFPSHAQALAYLRAYARQHQLERDICFSTEVQRVEPVDGQWLVTLSGNQPRRRYRGVVIANGHHREPLWPDFPGEFTGTTLHAHDYKTPDVLQGRRVLVVGAGNSGCDIAVESAQHAAATFHSLRRGYHYLPKFLLGRPIDQCGLWLQRWHLPLWLRRWVSAQLVRVAVGSPQQYGLPAPDHRLLASHPVINSHILYCAGHGMLRVKPDVERLCGDRVRFVDGSEEAIDVLVCATGYQLSFPFLDPQHLNWRDDLPQLFLHAFHPLDDRLYVAGMIQPNGGLWRLTDYQTQLMARFVAAAEQGLPVAARFRRLKAGPAPDLLGGIAVVRSPRHRLEVDYYTYRRVLKKYLELFAAGTSSRSQNAS